LDEVPLPQPRISVIGQQAVSKDPPVELQGFALDEILAVGYQNLLDEVGVVQEIDVTGKSAIVKDVTKLTSPLGIQPEGVRASQREVSDYAAIHWPGRTNQGHPHRPVVSASLVDFARSRLRMPMILNQDFESGF
jgi:hypothetical protein